MTDYVCAAAVALSFFFGGAACWAFVAVPRLRRAYDRGHHAGAFDSFPEYFELGRVAGHSTGFINGYTFGTGRPANELLTRLAELRAQQ